MRKVIQVQHFLRMACGGGGQCGVVGQGSQPLLRALLIGEAQHFRGERVAGSLLCRWRHRLNRLIDRLNGLLVSRVAGVALNRLVSLVLLITLIGAVVGLLGVRILGIAEKESLPIAHIGRRLCEPAL